MKIESVANADATIQSLRPFPEGSRVIHQQNFIKYQHKNAEATIKEATIKSEAKENKVSPAEILDKIRDISKDGLYSVRFEKSDKLDAFIVKVVDRETDEVIIQIPPEEILGIRAKMLEFTGNIVKSEG